tara:strand:- start:7 stop:555 length:549 start_codon:yes stop_codon:yes gene_type:complete
MSKNNGVVNGVYYCQQERTEQLSQRMFMRNIPSCPLQPQFSIRPVSTKYDCMSVVDRRPKPRVDIVKRPTYNLKNNFNPGNAQAPWSGFASHINDESRLRNQFFALQKCEQANYVPSSNSDMYNVEVGGREEYDQFSDLVKPAAPALGSLFVKPDLAPFNPNSCDIGKRLFNNHTRQQLLNV